ncbi:UNVERIFIED_CONTAM: ABC transporter permease, partial [Euhalothece sp. KZN 001]
MGVDVKWKRWTIALPLSVITVVGMVIVYRLQAENKSETQSPSVSQSLPKVTRVTALGRLEPKGEVIQVSTSQRSARVEELLVTEGETVEAGSVIAILDSFPIRKAAVTKAQQEVAVARSRLAKIQAGAQQGTINAQKATIERLKAELTGEKATQTATIERLKAEFRTAKAELERYEFLAAEGAISRSELDQRRLDLETARERYQEAITTRDKTINTLEKQILEAEATLEEITEIRPVDLQEAEAELQSAIASLEQAKADLELSKITAPRKGQIIEINTDAGEVVSETEGIIQLGNTEKMVAVAEVYESDIRRVKLGQVATLTSESNSFEEELSGKVSQIGLKIGKKDVLSSDPAANVDVRVIEVEIELSPASSQVVKGLT